MLHFTAQEVDGMEQRFRTQLINSLTGFKSLSLVGTISGKKESNLAVFSQIIHIGAHPPLIGILSRPDSVPRHTLQNIREEGAFTLNHVTSDFYEKAHLTSARWSTSEFDAVHLTEQYLDEFSAPYVKESVIKIGCEMREIINLSINGTHLIIGQIKQIYLPENSLDKEGFVDLEEAGTLTVSGLDSYHLTKKIARLPYAKAQNKPPLNELMSSEYGRILTVLILCFYNLFVPISLHLFLKTNI